MYRLTILHRIVSIILIASILQSCKQVKYYKVRTADLKEQSVIEVLKEKPEYTYVIHLGNNLWQLNKPLLTDQDLTGELTSLDAKTELYTKRAYEDKKFRIHQYDLKYINQIHVHVDQFERNGNQVTIAKNDISQVDIMDKNQARSFFATFGVVTLVTVVPIGIFLAIACNCPHTYAFDGENYLYNNTLFTGATSPNLERDDYKNMPDFRPESNSYSISIKNEEKELQYTNQLELIVVNHDANTEVSMDQDGNVYALRGLVAPIKVTNDNGSNLKSILAYNDNLGHQFNEKTDNDYNNVYASFDRPEDVSNAKLVIKAKNSKWAAGVYKEFTQLFGKYYDNWVKKNHKKSKEEVEANLKKIGIPLVVSIKNGGEWIDIESIDLIGEVNYNSLVIPIDEQYLTEENIEVRFKSGFFFWEMDYVNIDFTPNSEFDIQRLSPTIATGIDGTDDKANLSSDDDLYMEHLKSGDSTNIVFSGINSSTSDTRTIYLHSKGYYLPQVKYEGKMDRDELVKFKNEGEMSRFSKRLYDMYSKNVALISE